VFEYVYERDGKRETFMIDALPTAHRG